MKRAWILFVLFATGCGSSLVTLRGNSTSSYAPANEQQLKGGTVKYPNGGLKRSNREAAYRRMSAACGGKPYNITKEYPAADPLAGMEYIFLDFECLK